MLVLVIIMCIVTQVLSFYSLHLLSVCGSEMCKNAHGAGGNQRLKTTPIGSVSILKSYFETTILNSRPSKNLI